MDKLNPVVKVLKKDSGARLPEYETPGAAGADLRARITEARVIPPLGRARIPTGLALEIPPGFEAQVRPRSGLAARSGITVLNAPGTIDSDYRGELEVILINLGQEPFTIQNGDRIAQLVFAPVTRAEMTQALSLTETERGEGGFGSTGI
ncbi:dUTP diphosphatase [Treponema primitia ZAS-2]|uniref:Deoxyuridine 5'-triphosphate nucleotidohydrolase n=1 Tax=Treponema primitia (strain ATCC BAA-887 / DSM 12427 / ZAS-2) TaxID=545694 RepID=F5YM25_TREPZ|nr:dUTP diphosphatase [Treponema primitia]AEF83546.1 dUTP diphosphatase [Treponema primitia ZAS-2]